MDLLDVLPRTTKMTATTITTARTMSNNVRLVKPIALLGARRTGRVFVTDPGPCVGGVATVQRIAYRWLFFISSARPMT